MQLPPNTHCPALHHVPCVNSPTPNLVCVNHCSALLPSKSTVSNSTVTAHVLLVPVGSHNCCGSQHSPVRLWSDYRWPVFAAAENCCTGWAVSETYRGSQTTMTTTTQCANTLCKFPACYMHACVLLQLQLSSPNPGGTSIQVSGEHALLVGCTSEAVCRMAHASSRKHQVSCPSAHKLAAKLSCSRHQTYHGPQSSITSCTEADL
jgi:hypothetical protein